MVYTGIFTDLPWCASRRLLKPKSVSFQTGVNILWKRKLKMPCPSCGVVITGIPVTGFQPNRYTTQHKSSKKWNLALQLEYWASEILSAFLLCTILRCSNNIQRLPATRPRWHYGHGPLNSNSNEVHRQRKKQRVTWSYIAVKVEYHRKKWRKEFKNHFCFHVVLREQIPHKKIRTPPVMSLMRHKWPLP